MNKIEELKNRHWKFHRNIIMILCSSIFIYFINRGILGALFGAYLDQETESSLSVAITIAIALFAIWKFSYCIFTRDDMRKLNLYYKQNPKSDSKKDVVTQSTSINENLSTSILGNLLSWVFTLLFIAVVILVIWAVTKWAYIMVFFR
ncbi:MAG: hypothetical protein P1V18_00705 [Candidatus Gracilibacteria bacterium]|nr:hypothetical protein [Candidatus Gracilibacteria bacterium]